MASVYLYAISHDLGFAPNPFGGVCTLACCKPNIRARAAENDWVIGFTGTRLPPALRCVFAMVVTGEMTFDEYWAHPDFRTRRPKRNGTAKKLVGDNVYHRKSPESPWEQEDCAHSLKDGAQCQLNTVHDTRVNRILLSNRYIYFGSRAPMLPLDVQSALDYKKNSRDYRRFDENEAGALLAWIKSQMSLNQNAVVADPISFDEASKRYSARLQRMV